MEEQRIAAAGFEIAQQCLAKVEQPRLLGWQSLEQIKSLQSRFGHRLLGLSLSRNYFEGAGRASASQLK